MTDVLPVNEWPRIGDGWQTCRPLSSAEMRRMASLRRMDDVDLAQRLGLPGEWRTLARGERGRFILAGNDAAGIAAKQRHAARLARLGAIPTYPECPAFPPDPMTRWERLRANLRAWVAGKTDGAL
jgi:hypothetical protein